MFKQLSQPVVEKMKTDGRIMLTVKNGWETATSFNPIPYRINLCIENRIEHLFNCYLQIYDTAIIVSDVVLPTDTSLPKSIVDSHLYLAIDGLIKFTKMQKKEMVIIETTLKYAADHLPHYGFKLFSKEYYSTNSIKGILSLR